jgi:Tol biopolymer transport system component
MTLAIPLDSPISSPCSGLSELTASPDGKWLAFVVRTYSLEQNKSNADIWVVSADGKTLRQLTTSPAQDFSPCWSPAGNRLAFVSTRSGSAQIWTIDLAGGEARQLTSFRSTSTTCSTAPAETSWRSRRGVPGVFHAGDGGARCVAREGPVKARIYTELPFRHWDQWEDGKRSHLFVMPVAGGAGLDLMKDADADTPTKPFGGREEIAWSPDGKELCFASKMGEHRAWSTNVDLWITDAAGKARRCITEANQAMDTGPVYSPDGSTIAYRAMSRAGYESDRFALMLFERASGKSRALAPTFDRSVDELVWTGDGASLYLTAEDTARKCIFRVDVAYGDVKKVVADHYNTACRCSLQRHRVSQATRSRPPPRCIAPSPMART